MIFFFQFFGTRGREGVVTFASWDVHSDILLLAETTGIGARKIPNIVLEVSISERFTGVHLSAFRWIFRLIKHICS